MTPRSATRWLCNFGRAWSVVWASVFLLAAGTDFGVPCDSPQSHHRRKACWSHPSVCSFRWPCLDSAAADPPGACRLQTNELTGSQLWRVLRHEGRGSGLAESSCWRLCEGKHPVLTAEMKWCGHLLRVGTSWLRWG